MIKQVFIPLAVLGKQNNQILELYIESRCFKPVSCFESLTLIENNFMLFMVKNYFQFGEGMV